MQRYRYDAESRLLAYGLAQPQGGEETCRYDDADNIFGLPELDWRQIHGGKPDAFRDNRLPFWKQTGFSYDGFGNLVRRVQGSLNQQFAYDDENRLIRAWGEGPEGQHDTCYHYDALGRRTEKVVRRPWSDDAVATRFRWQGLRLIQEQGGGQCRTYIYDPNETYTPLARITQTDENSAGDIDYFHTDLNGVSLGNQLTGIITILPYAGRSLSRACHACRRSNVGQLMPQ